jgi:hypothetical protein
MLPCAVTLSLPNLISTVVLDNHPLPQFNNAYSVTRTIQWPGNYSTTVNTNKTTSRNETIDKCNAVTGANMAFNMMKIAQEKRIGDAGMIELCNRLSRPTLPGGLNPANATVIQGQRPFNIAPFVVDNLTAGQAEHAVAIAGVSNRNNVFFVTGDYAAFCAAVHNKINSILYLGAAITCVMFS